MPLLLYILLSNQGPFPPQALPHILSTTSLSATLPAQTAPRGFPVCTCHTTDRVFPCFHFSHLPCVPVPLARRKHIGAPIALFPMRQRLSPYNCRVIPFRGLLDILCATAHKKFTCVPARMFAESPEATLLTKVLQTMSLPP